MPITKTAEQVATEQAQEQRDRMDANSDAAEDRLMDILLGDEEEEEEGLDQRRQDADDEDSEDDLDSEDLDEDEDYDEEEDYEEEGDEEEHEKSLGEMFTVKVNGEEQKVTKDELLKGYSRQADYTRKTQEISEARNTLSAEMEQVSAERQQYVVLLTQLSDVLRNHADEGIDWNKLKAENPLQYTLKRDEQRQRQEKISAAEEEIALTQQREAQRYEAYLEEQKAANYQKLLEAVPEWSDPVKKQQAQSELMEYALEMGYEADDLRNLFDHRIVLILRDAVEYNKLKKKGKKLQRTKTKSAVPGSRTRKPKGKRKTSRAQAKQHAAARQRLKESGSLDDAAEALRAFF